MAERREQPSKLQAYLDANRKIPRRTKFLLVLQGGVIIGGLGLLAWANVNSRPNPWLTPKDNSSLPFPERGSDIEGFYVDQYSPRLLWIRDRDSESIRLNLSRTQRLIDQIDRKCQVVGPLQSTLNSRTDNNIYELTVAIHKENCRDLLTPS